MKINIGFGEVHHEFQCFNNISEQILGRDFCEKQNLFIDFKNNKIGPFQENLNTKTPEENEHHKQDLLLQCNSISPSLQPEYQDISRLDKRVVEIIYNYPKPIDLTTVALERNPHFKFYVELEDYTPIRTKMRPIPISIQPAVNQLLEDLEKRNII